jgi:hypothetical protein
MNELQFLLGYNIHGLFFMEMVTQMVLIQRIYSSVAIVEFECHLLSVQMTI